MSKTILITGGAGFIGSNFMPYFCEKYSEYNVINLDKLTYAGNLDNLCECENMPNYTFIQGDICDTGMFREDTPYTPNSPYSASKVLSLQPLPIYGRGENVRD